MTSIVRQIVSLVIGLALTISCAHAAEFAELVRELNIMQNRIVMGDTQAQAAAARQFDIIEHVLSTLDPEIWADERNVRAAATYLLAGGDPSQVREYFDAGFVPVELSPLLEASLSYAEGQSLTATKLLMDLDARRFPPVLGGHLALVQGGSISGVDKARAATLFDLARLLMPASLVEEAALRREVAVIDPSRDSDKLSLLASRYVTKYSASPYARHFWNELRGIVLNPERRGDDDYFKKFQAALERAQPSDRVDIVLTLTRRDILDGRLGAASEKLSLAKQGVDAPLLKKRVDAYRVVIDALASAGGDSGSLIENVDKKDLQLEDVELLRIAAAALARTSEVAAAQLSPIDEPIEAPAILERARAAIESSDALLELGARK